MSEDTSSKDTPDVESQPGACYITDNQTGRQICRMLTPAACSARGGVFVGGLCGPGIEASPAPRPEQRPDAS